MTIDEHTRHGIHTWFVEAMGERYGDGLMSMLPPTGWADVATKQDLAQLEDRLELRFDNVEQRFEHGFGMIDQRFGMIDQRFETMEYKVLGALDRRLTDSMRALFFAVAGLLVALTTIIVSVVIATR